MILVRASPLAMMRSVISLPPIVRCSTLAVVLLAWAPTADGQAPNVGSRPAVKNLQVLTPDVNLSQVMNTFNVALGVQCSYCHDAGDFASDANPKKRVARNMLVMWQRINLHFPDAGNDFLKARYLPFPEGKQYVTCYTCHRGQTVPANTLTDWHGPDRAPEPGAPERAGRGRGTATGAAAGARGPAAEATAERPAESKALPPTRGNQTHTNMVYLPSNVNTQFVMPALRAAIGVECNFCHVGGAQLERGHANERDFDTPKKLTARNMMGMVKEINAALFPGEDVDVALVVASTPPAGKHYVTCYTCHRGEHLPPTVPRVATR
jgi:photosynthetic reaction center cytochrome c subunit